MDQKRGKEKVTVDVNELLVTRESARAAILLLMERCENLENQVAILQTALGRANEQQIAPYTPAPVTVPNWPWTITYSQTGGILNG